MRKHHILYIAIINVLSFICVNNTSALSYSSDVNIGFTFDPTISISVSGDLLIPNLTPGNSADSNSITVSVATNTAYGYTLTSTVGSSNSNNGNSTGNNSRNLVNSIDNNQSFTSLDYGSNIADKTNFNDNTWGYSYSLNNSNNWRPYSGLPLYSDVNHSTVLYSTYDAAGSVSLDFKIAAKSSTTQASGEYTNIINFYAVSVPEPPLLYDVVQNMTKGTLADNNVKLSDTITQANSGVYTYDPTVYGVASDASNDYPIYFYRGILDTTEGLGTYGSDGMADAWPNHVKLGNGTCWRIVRTTGSGGVKMIYNGLYGATTVGSCANATTNAQATTQAFGLKGNSSKSNWQKNINRIGYTFNNASEIQDTETSTSADILFGSNSNYSTTNTENSNIKDYLENTWFTDISSYESRLEPSAGYCNDRSIYDASGNLLSDNVGIITPFANVASGATIYSFGARQRNTITEPSLICPRGIVDLYTASGALDGNKQLYKPVVLITMDEASFAGISWYPNMKSFLCSGSGFWFFSPSIRNSNGYSYIYNLKTDGSFSNNHSGFGLGVRPVISLMHHIQVTGGSGTATSPWTIE